MKRLSSAMLVLAVALPLGACAGGAPERTSVSAASQGERQQFCRNQMYGERTARGRSAPNWNLYEQCMRGG